MSESAPSLMTVADAARFLHMSRSFLDKARGRGDGPEFSKCGVAIRYDQADLTAWVNKRRRRSTSDAG